MSSISTSYLGSRTAGAIGHDASTRRHAPLEEQESSLPAAFNMCAVGRVSVDFLEAAIDEGARGEEATEPDLFAQ